MYAKLSYKKKISQQLIIPINTHVQFILYSLNERNGFDYWSKYIEIALFLNLFLKLLTDGEFFI